MGSQNISNSTTTDLTNGVTEYTTNPISLDFTNSDGDTFVYFPDAAKNFGYYKTDAALYSGMNTLANWIIGRGWTCLSKQQEENLKLIKGWGKDTFSSILMNLLITKFVVSDSFAEIIRVDNSNPKSALLNIRPISPERMRLVINSKGLIKHYEAWNGTDWIKLEKHQVLHLSNGRIGDEIHGTSKLEACKWVIDARRECMNDWRRISHRSSLRVLYVDVFNTAKVNQLREQYKEGIENGEVLVLPGKKGEIEFEDLKLPDVNAFLNWIQYLENFFYQILGIPKSVMGGTVAVSEGNSKVGIFSWEQVYLTEQRQLEEDLWQQLNIMIDIDAAPSMMENLQANEAKNTSQMAMQPKDAKITGGRE